ncbi:hypothetical protein I302_104611 [Kwoniella bestiolae CBS 10118]|uniref:Xylanolytic transcriptional activator regulatory domain-containing protein n=1 Tax=Kwoniella bestiolae CBS 10118 TaxID=1296100 RepID=A0A1B9GBR1_9TREE|nr:hypothetical protein I302_03318 [Kwoniella bestiolae CBS 10118]OCF28459.1 hypothetical protein I302_03318 [Kwoniella bestiolae CBS 10118]
MSSDSQSQGTSSVTRFIQYARDVEIARKLVNGPIMDQCPGDIAILEHRHDAKALLPEDLVSNALIGEKHVIARRIAAAASQCDPFCDIIGPTSSSLISEGKSVSDMKDLVRLYFRTVHHFGYLSFVHEADYWELEERNRAPEDLRLLMAAHAVRFGGQLKDPLQLELADRWVLEVGERLIPKALTEFGAVELMEVVLCQTYDFLNGRYQRGMVMAGMAVRMMTFLRLNELDEWPRQAAKPLLSRESLRRLAWSVWFVDATLDGGVFGASNIHEDAFTIQLPCDDRPFLLHRQVVTETLVPKPLSSIPSSETSQTEPLDLSGHLIRAMSARQHLAQAYSRIRRRLLTHGSISEMGRQAEDKAKYLLDSLTPDLAYSRALYYIYHDRRPSLVLLHVVRNNCIRHTSLLRMMVGQITSDLEIDQVQERQNLISSAIQLSHILNDAMDHNVTFDPQIAMHAYNAIEILLFQPIRLAIESTEGCGLSREEILVATKPFLHVIRIVSAVCPLVNLIYPEAINRMVQMGYVDDLTNDDILAVLQKIHSLTDAEKEFDWTESFWRYEVFLSRRSRVGVIESNHAGGAGRSQLAESPEDALLEVPAPVPVSIHSFSPTTVPLVQLESPNSSIQQPGNIVSSPQSMTNATTLAQPIPQSPAYPDQYDPQSSSDPISRLQNLFATRRPESIAVSPVPYVAISDLTPGGNEQWPLSSTSGLNHSQAMTGMDDFSGMFIDGSVMPTTQSGLEGVFPPFSWR